MANVEIDTFNGVIGATYQESIPHREAPAQTREATPNIVLIVLDDVGFSDIGCYGSEISTPRMDALAGEGVRYNNFHVTAMCSSTRACLMTGRNAHAVGVGIIAEWANGFPGYQGRMTRKAATIAEMLGSQGYGCYATGKWHLTNLADYGAAGPHGDWPLGRGFSRWYGFHGALVDQWNPELYEDNHPINLKPTEGYHLSDDIVNKTISQIKDHVTSAPDRPFFSYVAFGACHWPHQVPREYIDAYRGKYDEGWDRMREARFDKQKKIGIVPGSCEMAPRNPGVEAWQDLPDDVKKLSCALQETYAAFLEHTDTQIGRLVDYLDSIGSLENTVVMVVSDNGASAEGGTIGAFNMRKHFTHEQETVEGALSKVDLLGSEHAFSHYPMGWAQVSNTPLKWYKKDTHEGGIRAPLIVRWPQGISARGEIREQFHHAIDVLPTLLDCASAHAPATYQGIEQMPVHGVTMRYTFEGDTAPSTRKTQYFELLGDRALWQDGWKAVARHTKGDDYKADKWELYKIDDDFTECHDLAGSHPSKLSELVDAWWSEARRFGVLPLDDREAERAHAFLASKTRKQYVYHAGMSRIDRLMLPEITDRSYEISVELSKLTEETEGVIFSWGSRFAGFILYAQNGQLVYEYVYSEATTHRLTSPLPRGNARVTIDFERTGKDAGKASLVVDKRLEAQVAIPKTWWNYSMTAGLTCGFAAVPVSERFRPPFMFSGEIGKVVVTPGIHDRDMAEEKYNAVMRDQ